MGSSRFPLQFFTFLLLHLLLSSGSSVAERPQLEAIQKTRKLENVDLFTTQFDTTVPIVNPTTPGTNPGTSPNTPIVNPATSPPPPTTTMTPITNPTPSTTPPVSTTPGSTPPGSTTPGSTPPGSSGGQWCIASSTASETALQVALDYACGYGGADCSQLQPGASCYNPNTVRDHASFAFNDYYHKNPAPTSCVFGGTAQLTSTDPSSGSCHYPSSTGSTSITPPATPTMANPPPSPTTTNPYTTPTIPDITTPTSPDSTVYGSAEPTGLPSSANSLSCGLLLLAATGFVWSLLAENYV